MPESEQQPNIGDVPTLDTSKFLLVTEDYGDTAYTSGALYFVKVYSYKDVLALY